MTAKASSHIAHLMAWLVVILTAAFLCYGLFRYGFSYEVHQRIWRDVFDRSHGPMTFRFFLQPTMAAIAALYDGIKDARLARAPYLSAILHDSEQRGGRLREGLISIARIILLGFGMDAIYQWRVFGTFYPGEAIVITLILAVIPYFILRGPIERIARWWFARGNSRSAA